MIYDSMLHPVHTLTDVVIKKPKRIVRRKIKNRIVAYFDGGCWPNPKGKARAGVYITDGYNTLLEQGFDVGEGNAMSSNVAEYSGLIRILEFLSDKLDKNITIYGDSTLVIKQMQGRWKMKSGRYFTYAARAKELVRKFQDISFHWIPREKNERCDRLAELALVEA